MSRQVLYKEMLDQIELRSASDFESSLLSGQIGIDKLATLKSLFDPICRRLSIEPIDLTPKHLDRLARSEWIEFGVRWLTYSQPILGTSSLIYTGSDDNFEPDDAQFPGDLEGNIELVDLIDNAATIVMDEETDLFDAVVRAIRLMAIVYQANAYNKSFDKRAGFESQAFAVTK